MSSSAMAQGSILCDRYDVGERLGRGGMADVHAGRDVRLERDVAIKLLRPEVVARQPEVRARFEAEARSAARLSHPNVVAMYDTGEHEGLPFIVMERLPGETLADRIREGPVDLEWLRRVAGDVLGALGAAHAAGMVHRDVKPGNILLAEDGRAKVADFGIAKSLDGTGPDLTATNLLIGTPAYLAPEQVAGEPATPRSDLYALGVVLYEAAAGRKPFTGNTPVAIAYAIEHAEVEPLASVRPDVDGAMSATVERAMDRDPARRFGSASEMAGALGLAPATDETVQDAVPMPVDTDPTDPTVVAAAPLATPLARRSPRWLPAAVAVAALLLLAGFAFAMRGEGGGGPSPARSDAQEEAPASTDGARSTDEETTTTVADLGQEIRSQVEEQLDGAGIDVSGRGDDDDDGAGKGKGQAKGKGDD